ncbi:MAG: TIGR00159 family protein [Lachnospiraceae bacterium]|nr:TIGR00159 family protein [Lachnospiraceae bacterium]
MFQYILDFVEKYLALPKVYLSDVIEVFIITVIVYYVMLWFKRTRAWVIFKGLIVLVLFLIIAAIFNLSTILWIANRTLSVGIIAIVIIFQPELRRALEDLGNKNIVFNIFKNTDSELGRFSDRSMEEIVRATLELAKAKTGALIVIEQENDLSRYDETGIVLDSTISSQLLINIFEHNTPLHDGAVLIRNDRISSATCYLPLSENLALSKDLGTRHRAGVGVSEVTDSFVIIVSEETGSISIASQGKLIRYADAAILKNELIKVQNKTVPKEKKNRISKRRGQNEVESEKNLDDDN